MSQLRTPTCIAGLLALLLAWPMWGQKTGGSGSQGGSAPPTQPGGSTSSTPRQPEVSSQPSTPQMQTPLFVNGRVIMDTGQPVPEPVSVGLNCGTTSVQVIRTDLKGYFQFTLGAGVQGNMDMSASNDTPGMSAANGMGIPSGFGGAGSASGMGNALFGCELQVSVPGYEPLVKAITEPPDIGGIDAGTLQLRRIAGVRGTSISVTSLLVPNNARKEFDKADKDIHSNHLASATEHLEKAVGEYDKYAAAWNELGTIYSSGHQTEKANQAFTKAISSDPQYIPPYVGLAALELQNAEYESANETAGKALDLDPRIGLASFIKAAADFKLNRLDEAEKSALNAEKEPHQAIPQVHLILSNIFVEKQDYPSAAAQMRAYLKEAPKGNFADETRKNLEQMEKATGSADGKPGQQAEIAP